MDNPQANLSRLSDRTSFWIPVTLFCLVWTIAPLFFLPNYWLDIIEQFFVGREWVISTGKHPAFTATLFYHFWQLTGKAVFAPYLLSQLMMGTVLWTVWKMGKIFLNPRLASATVFVMFNYYWMNFGSADYNNNVTLIFAWALSVYFGLMALKTDRLGYWVALGVAVGLGLNFKYTVIFYVAALFLFLGFCPEGRRQYRSWKFYLSAAMANLLFAPQLIWLLNGHLRTIEYALTLEGEKNAPIYHLLCPLHFLLSQSLYIVGFAILLLPLIYPTFRKSTKETDDGSAPSRPVFFHSTGKRLTFDEAYLLAMTILPFLFQIIYAAISAQHVRFSLGCHLWIFVPILLLRFLPVHETDNAIFWTKFQNILIAIIVLIASVAITIAYPYVTGKCSRYLFPGRQLAAEVEKAWDTHYDIPIPWATGEWWLTGNVAVYGKDHPRIIYSRGPDTFCGPWLATTWGTYDDIRHEGGVLLWEIRDGEPNPPERLEKLFPEAILCEEIRMRALTSAPIPEFRFGMAILPPPANDSTPPEEPSPRSTPSEEPENDDH